VHKSTWKLGEQTLAKFFGTTRTPLSGGNSKVTRSDSLSERLFLEMKKGAYTPKRFSSIVELYLKTEALALAEGKIPIVVIREAGVSAPTGEWMGWVRLSHLGIPSPRIVAMSLADIRDQLGFTAPNEPAGESAEAASETLAAKPGGNPAAEGGPGRGGLAGKDTEVPWGVATRQAG
jgi:hypothetical protein